MKKIYSNYYYLQDYALVCNNQTDKTLNKFFVMLNELYPSACLVINFEKYSLYIEPSTGSVCGVICDGLFNYKFAYILKECKHVGC